MIGRFTDEADPVRLTSDAVPRTGRAAAPAPVDPARRVAAPGDGERPSAVEPHPQRRRLLANRHLWAVTAYLALAGWVTERFWLHLGRYSVADNGQDHIQFEYYLVWATRVVTKLENPFHLARMNVPDGVNLMANTPAYGLTIPLVPVTLLFGPQVSFAVMTMIAIGGTAAAWYWLFYRHLVGSWIAALVGGAFCGFGPGMLAQALAHPNIAAQFVVPLILAQLIMLRIPGRTVRRGLVLGLLITYQAFINEEILFFTALCCAVFFGTWALARRRDAAKAARSFLGGLGIAAGVAGALLAYPLRHQFSGPGAYHGMWYGAERFGADLRSYVLFSSRSIAGSPGNARFSEVVAEQNAYFGWPLLVACAVLIATMWRRRPALVLAVCVTGAFAFLMSLGPRLIVNGHRSTIPGPYNVVFHLPLFDSVIATRWSLALIPMVATLLALWLDTMLAAARRAPRDQAGAMRVVAAALVIVALLPLAPRRIDTNVALPIPRFFSSGEWRGYVPAGRTVVPVPLASNAQGEEPMRWAAETGVEPAMPGGYFLGPDPRTPERRSMFGSPPRPTSNLFIRVDRSGRVPRITATDRANAVADLRYWRAGIVVVPAERSHEKALRELVTRLLGFEPAWRNGVWVWDVRYLAS
jgi:hypothetical protein